MNDAWFYRLGDSQVGPVPMFELRRLMSTGQIGPAIAIWCDGMPGWMPAAQVPGLMQSEGGLQFLVPTGRTSASSFAAGYLGLIGMIILPLGIAALVFGVLGVRDLRQHREKNGWGRAITGIVLGGLETLALLLWIVLVVVRR